MLDLVFLHPTRTSDRLYSIVSISRRHFTTVALWNSNIGTQDSVTTLQLQSLPSHQI